jgi:predicted tellurium resistance membrane protein TerC
MEWLSDPQAWIALATLTALEIVFISILAGKLPKNKRDKARKLGLSLAMFIRILLLLSISWVVGLTDPLFTAVGQEISGRDLILLFGGLFLLGKSTHEMHGQLEADEGHASAGVGASFGAVIVQILLLDIIFSLDSVITAVGMADDVGVMIVAVVIAVGFMFVFAGAVSGFVEKHPTIKMLALSFLLLIGMSLVAESFDIHIPKGYIYFAMAFSLFVEMLNIRLRKSRQPPVDLHSAYAVEPEQTAEPVPGAPAATA